MDVLEFQKTGLLKERIVEGRLDVHHAESLIHRIWRFTVGLKGWLIDITKHCDNVIFYQYFIEGFDRLNISQWQPESFKVDLQARTQVDYFADFIRELQRGKGCSRQRAVSSCAMRHKSDFLTGFNTICDDLVHHTVDVFTTNFFKGVVPVLIVLY